MPVPYTESMPDTATYWSPGIASGTGNLDFSGVVPILIACRWQNVQALYRDAQGQEFLARAIVYPDRELALQGYLALGNATSASDPRDAGAHEIRNVQASPSLDGAEVLFKVTL